MPGPYVLKNQESMDMIRHYYERIERHIREMGWNLLPAGRHNLTGIVTDGLAIPTTNSDEVSAWSGVVKTREADGSAVR